MASPMLNTQFRSIAEPILNKAFDGIYANDEMQYKLVFDEMPGIPRDYHEEPYIAGFAAAPLKPAATPVTYAESQTFYSARYRYDTYGLAFALSRELIEDSKHINLGSIFAKHLGKSMKETKEVNGANILNFSFNNTSLGLMEGGDGVSLVNTAHPLLVGGTFSNRLAIDANLSQTSVEQLTIQIRRAVDSANRFINLKPVSLVVAPQNMHQATVILNSYLRSGTANNDINPMNEYFQDGVINLQRLTSDTAWWIKTDSPAGLQCVWRRQIERTMEGDFETDSMRYKATERYKFGWTDPRTIYGTSGA